MNKNSSIKKDYFKKDKFEDCIDITVKAETVFIVILTVIINIVTWPFIPCDSLLLLIFYIYNLMLFLIYVYLFSLHFYIHFNKGIYVKTLISCKYYDFNDFVEFKSSNNNNFIKIRMRNNKHVVVPTYNYFGSIEALFRSNDIKQIRKQENFKVVKSSLLSFIGMVLLFIVFTVILINSIIFTDIIYISISFIFFILGLVYLIKTAKDKIIITNGQFVVVRAFHKNKIVNPCDIDRVTVSLKKGIYTFKVFGYNKKLFSYLSSDINSDYITNLLEKLGKITYESK